MKHSMLFNIPGYPSLTCSWQQLDEKYFLCGTFTLLLRIYACTMIIRCYKCLGRNVLLCLKVSLCKGVTRACRSVIPAILCLHSKNTDRNAFMLSSPATKHPCSMRTLAFCSVHLILSRSPFYNRIYFSQPYLWILVYLNILKLQGL